MADLDTETIIKPWKWSFLFLRAGYNLARVLRETSQERLSEEPEQGEKWMLEEVGVAWEPRVQEEE